MNKKQLIELLTENQNPLIFDGAMGTMLHNHGESFEGCLDCLNITKPASVAEIHREYIEAGSQIIVTNTFGANHFKLAEHGLENKLEEINRAGVELAKKVGAEYAYDPREVTPGEVMMELSKGEGFDFHVEAAGAPELIVPEMEKALAINSKVVQIGRAAQRVPMYLESFQVRRAQAFGAQGHSGHENFPNVIRLVASGRLDLSPIVTARYGLDDTVQAIKKSIERADGKIMVLPN
jgi:Zn-dependent alcohol dehydrogenase